MQITYIATHLMMATGLTNTHLPDPWSGTKPLDMVVLALGLALLTASAIGEHIVFKRQEAERQ